MGFDSGDRLETSKHEALSGDSGQWAGRSKGSRALLAAAMMLSTTKAENQIAVVGSYEVVCPTTSSGWLRDAPLRGEEAHGVPRHFP
eukprot:7458524-Pyramimonas_sp.AAC.1